MSIFLSTFVNSLDSKDRVVVPKEFRNSLEPKFEGFVAFRSHKTTTIEGFSMEKMQKLSKEIEEKMDPFSDDLDNIASVVFADACILRFDTNGRIVLPAHLKKHAQIKDKVAFVGRGATFQMWSPELFDLHQKEIRNSVKK